MWMSFYLGTFFAVKHDSNPDTIVVRGETEEDLDRLLDSMSSEDRELCSVVIENERIDNHDFLRRVEMPRDVFSKTFVDKEEEDVDFIKCDCMYLVGDDTSEADINETES